MSDTISAKISRRQILAGAGIAAGAAATIAVTGATTAAAAKATWDQ